MKNKQRSDLSMHLSHQILLTALIIVVIAGTLGSCSYLNAPNYEETECQLFTESSREIECGVLQVPEDRSKEDGPMVELHFAIARSRNPDKEKDPLVALQGGPGMKSLEMIDFWLYILDKTLLNRDVIVIDQRGVGYSQPSLNCPELEDPFFANFAEDISMLEQDQRFTQALRTCRDRLVATGIDLGAYNSAASAADVDDLRRALGYSEWNLYGSSYGTRLALTVMRDFPQGVRSAILDSVYPPQVDLFSSKVIDMQRALNLLFERCAADAECNQDYPDLERIFYEVVDQVDEQPVTLSVYRPKNLEEYPVVINGDRFIQSFFDLLYSTDDLPKLPGLIYEIRTGDWDDFERMIRWSLFTFDDLSEGVMYSVECFEEAPFGSPQAVQAANAAANPRLSQAMNNAAAYQDCAAWDVPPAAAFENKPVVSDIPTLILSGEHDPITPPAWGELTAEGLSKSQHLVLPGTGHGVLGKHNCSNQVVEEFLAAPDEPVDASCMDEVPVLFGGN